ncbi:MAG: ribonuclease H family protein [Saprospiraceae bacterium]|nr:ribonuclease H family protein [Saprospiraceae bacterium]
MAKKFYVVWEGHTPGVYDDWADAKRQVDGFPAAKYKSFPNKAEAEQAFKGNYWAHVQKSAPKKSAPPSAAAILRDSLSVDAACSGNPGPMEYRGVYTATGQELFHIGPLDDGTNNIGEFLAIVHALALLQKEGKPQLPIYSDSRNAQLWIKAKKCRTKLERTGRNNKIFELIDRAEKWLAVNKVTNPILKWETEAWGEIPADFGRK